MAREVLKTHDHILAGRTITEAVKTVSHHGSSLTLGAQGPRWRFLRRIVSTELITSKRLHALQHLRRDEVSKTVRLIFDDSRVNGKSVNISHTAFYTGFNLIGNMMFSTSVYDPNNPDSAEFKNLFLTCMKLVGKPNLADFFPWLGILDPQGVVRRIQPVVKRMEKFLDGFIQNRVATRSKSTGHKNEANKDFLDALLDLEGHDLTLIDIRGLILELFFGGSESTSTIIEWVMAELIRDPHTMKRVQNELEEVVGRNRRVEECDIEHLPYLVAVVKEGFRLHPSLPLMLPHKAESCCEVAGFSIPKDTQVILNVWGIGRDPAIWEEPSKFVPERFIEGKNSEMEYKGHDFELLPFGSGRRMCPGLPVAHRMVHLILASLIHSFEWALPYGMKAEELDMNDAFGVSLKKAEDLCAIPTPRLPHHLY